MYKLWRLGRKVINVKREQQIRAMVAGLTPVRHRSSVVNVYHCCVWKTASQWVRNVFSSSSVYRYSGLLPYDYEQQQGEDDRPLQTRTFEQAAPPRRIVSPLYADYRHFAAMPKPDEYRAFFVGRDPRDLVVSHYFSSRYSHASSAGVEQERAQLANLSEADGMVVHMRYMADRGVFAALEAWHEASAQNPRCRFVRYEDLTGAEQFEHYRRLMEFCDIRIPETAMRQILQRLSFEKLSDGRKKGEENKFHKYRSGKPGDWRRYFDEGMNGEFEKVAGNLVDRLGYKTHADAETA